MPLVKRSAVSPPAAAGSRLSQIESLRDPDPEARWNAARALGGDPEAITQLSAALETENVARVREAITTALIRIGGEASVVALMPYLRSQDAARRAATIEALQAMPEAIEPFMSALLQDTDSDVRILSTELARTMPPDAATRLLTVLLEAETHPNVCAAAVEVLSEVGTPDALPVLRSCATRFATTAFLPFAISVAMSRIARTES